MAKKTRKQIILKLDPLVIEDLNDPRVKICEFCGEPMFLASGAFGYSCYTIHKYGSKWRSTLTRKHYNSSNGACLKEWLKDPRHRRDLIEPRPRPLPIAKTKKRGKK